MTFATIMQRHVGRHAYSLRKLADETQIPTSTLKGYRSGAIEPTFANLRKLTGVLGTAFLNDWLALMGAGGAYFLAGADPCPWKLNASNTGFGAVLGAALEDGHLDHQERIQVRRAARKHKAAVSEFVNASNR